jgi:hypothetical protein
LSWSEGRRGTGAATDRNYVVMEQGQSQLPTEIDFLDPRSRDLDERHAVKVFLGKTPDEAEAMFRENFLFYQEDLTYMRAPAFRFYVVPAIKYLLSADANGDSDAASTFCDVLESRLKYDPGALEPIVPVVLDAIEKILVGFDRFDCSPDIYGDVPSRYRSVATWLAP